jgi:hypothetical protein
MTETMICAGSLALCLLIAGWAVGMMFLIEWIEHEEERKNGRHD